MGPLSKPGIKTTEFWAFTALGGVLLALFDKAVAVNRREAYVLAGIIAVVLGVCWIVYVLTRNDAKAEAARREAQLLRSAPRRRPAPSQAPPAERSVWDDPHKTLSDGYMLAEPL